jgi:hypothetical protein
MKNQRILLFLSPLLFFIPPLLPGVQDNAGIATLMFFYARILRRFPWNLLMAAICYSYAGKIGRDTFRWSLGAFVAPYLTPLILAFVPPHYSSRAAMVNAQNAPPRPVDIKGAFEERFPLLSRRLAEQPEAVRQEQKTRFAAAPSNFEFLITVRDGAMDVMLTDALIRKLTVWASPENQLFGAGVVLPAAFDETIAWLRRNCSEQTKMEVSARSADGRIKFFEYYP